MGLLDLIFGKKRKVTASEARRCSLPKGATVRVKKRRSESGAVVKDIRYRGRVAGRDIQ